MPDPLANEVETRALFLAQSADFVTFLDLLPLAKQVATYTHLPAATVAALVHLGGQKRTTPGARAVLERTLAGYVQRIKAQRSLAQRKLRVTDHGRIARLVVGGTVEVVLLPQGGSWVLDGTQEPTWELTTETMAGGKQVFCVAALSAGLATLNFYQVQPRHGPAAQPSRGSGRQRDQLRLTVLIESSTDAALFCD